MDYIKMLIVGGAIAAIASLIAKPAQAWYCAKLALLAQYSYAWLLALPSKIDLSKLEPAARTRLLQGYQHVVLGLVMIEEALLPDAGLGPDRKAGVLKRLELLGLPDAIAKYVPDFIEAGVKTMDAEAAAFISSRNPPATP